jgi:hypothetical protein
MAGGSPSTTPVEKWRSPMARSRRRVLGFLVGSVARAVFADLLSVGRTTLRTAPDSPCSHDEART